MIILLSITNSSKLAWLHAEIGSPHTSTHAIRGNTISFNFADLQLGKPIFMKSKSSLLMTLHSGNVMRNLLNKIPWTNTCPNQSLFTVWDFELRNWHFHSFKFPLTYFSLISCPCWGLILRHTGCFNGVSFTPWLSKEGEFLIYGPLFIFTFLKCFVFCWPLVGPIKL